MAADLILTNDGIKYSGGNIIDLKAAMPSTGSYVAGDIVLESTTDGRVSGWKRLTTGSGHILDTDWRYFSASPQLGTAAATTSGTSIDFTGIPSWVKRVTVMLNACSTTGTSPYQVQLGAGSIQTSGYSGGVSHGTTSTSNSSGFVAQSNVLAALASSGHVVLTKVSGNTWAASVVVGSPGSQSCVGGGSVTLTGALDRVRLTTVGGTDTFDAGSFNILVE